MGITGWGLRGFAFALLVLGAAPAAAQESTGTPRVGPHAATPEEACRMVYEAIADSDVDGILAISSAASAAAGYRFDRFIDRVQVFLPSQLAPSEYPMFRRIDEITLQDRLLTQVVTMTYALLSDETIDGEPKRDKDAEWARRFTEQVDPARLSSLTVADIRFSDPEFARDATHLAWEARAAAMWGADESTERVVLLTLDDRTWMGGCRLLRYGADWTVSGLGANLAGLSPLGVPEPITPEEFERRTGG